MLEDDTVFVLRLFTREHARGGGGWGAVAEGQADVQINKTGQGPWSQLSEPPRHPQII